MDSIENTYAPEGFRVRDEKNCEYLASVEGLRRAMREGKILEAPVRLCDASLDLHVDLLGIRGIIPHSETVYCRKGETIKDIAVITRVGKSVCFKVSDVIMSNGMPLAILSRRAAQEECQKNYMRALRAGDVIPAKVTHLESFGAFLDIGCGLSSLLAVDSISVSRISHPSDRMRVGENIFVVVKGRTEDSERLYVTMKELLGSWQENADMFEVGQTVAGVVRSIEDYGVFVELSPNLAGLAEIRPGTRDAEIARVGSTAAVYIKSILPDRMKIKLVLIDTYRGTIPEKKLRYFVDPQKVEHIHSWRYSPPSSTRIVETVFDEQSLPQQSV